MKNKHKCDLYIELLNKEKQKVIDIYIHMSEVKTYHYDLKTATLVQHSICT